MLIAGTLPATATFNIPRKELKQLSSFFVEENDKIWYNVIINKLFSVYSETKREKEDFKYGYCNCIKS